ncbi:hypothetical protein RF644_10160 [Kocuria sp. CPCC 205258]|uniref:hypothetical protein n=1 Tax=Kocuria sp. CPCC 205258 TaxID=3073552 RepID=UPI0034D5CC05
MARLIDVRPQEENIPSELGVTVGDVIRFIATGGRVRSGTSVELLGMFTDSVVGTDGSVLTPSGPPTTVLFRARQLGDAVVDVVAGFPFHHSKTWSVLIRVAP